MQVVFRYLLLLCCCAVFPAAATDRPNILILLADDLGYDDLGVHGADMPTAHMDRLANESLRFDRFYGDATCQPARVALLSGRYPSRAGFRPVGRGIPPEWTTLPEALQQLGYRTHHVGKWHIGYDTVQAWPQAQGFDTVLGFLHQWFLGGPMAAGDYRLSGPTYENPWLIDTAGDSRQYPGHLTEILADHTVRLIQDADRQQPWFIYHAFLDPHTPAQPPEPYRSRYPQTPAGQYRAQVHHLDDAVGRILQALEESGQADNTIVLLASDNGGDSRSDARPGQRLAGAKGSFDEGGVRTFLFWRWPGHVQPGAESVPASLLDVYPSLLQQLGVAPDTVLDGQPLLSGQVATERPLFWEGVVFEGVSRYGVLSADGRWRLVSDWPFPRLLDLQADPAGSRQRFSPRLTEGLALRNRYVDWRDTVRRSEVVFEPDGDAGHGHVTGDRFQRTPGIGGFSVALGVRPQWGEGWQTLLEQPPVLVLQYHPEQGLKGQVNGLPLSLPGPLEPENGCLRIVLSGYWFAPSLLWGGEPDSRLRLFVNGRERLQSRGSFRYVPESAYAEPTWIGRDATGSQRFIGRLGMPVFLNDTVTAEDAKRLGQAACP